MTDHFVSFLRVAIVFAFAMLAMPLLRGRSAVARRLVLTAAFGFVLVIPFVPAWHVDAPAVRGLQGFVGHLVVEARMSSAPARAVPVVTRGPSIDWLALVWAVGALLVIARCVMGLFFAHRLVRRASVATDAGWRRAMARAESTTSLRAAVRVSEEIDAPAVTGIFAPVILVPASSARWTDARKHAVLVHELAHVAACDLLAQIVATIVCSLHWFNPLAWLALRRLRLERELAADEAVLRSGTRASAYAEDLLAIAGAAPAGTISIGEKPLPKRIAAIVAARRPAMLGSGSAVALFLGTAAISLGVACASTTEGPTGAVAAASRAVDPDLQVMAERELDRAVTQWKATGGTILVLSPKGEVLADAGGHADRAYVAGSTMKPFLLAAALDEDVVKESDVFDCNKGERGGKTLHDSHTNGELALPEMMAVSSNIGFAQVFDRLGGARYDRALHHFHFTPPGDLSTRPAGDWDGALLAIGATMPATPRQVALGYAAFADGGDGIVKKSTAERVNTVLEGVVASEHGTGGRARVPGVRVAGKTGTSEWTTADGAEMTYASFVGFVPADRPRYVIFVGIESPSGEAVSGGQVAAPVFSRVAARALAR